MVIHAIDNAHILNAHSFCSRVSITKISNTHEKHYNTETMLPILTPKYNSSDICAFNYIPFVLTPVLLTLNFSRFTSLLSEILVNNISYLWAYRVHA